MAPTEPPSVFLAKTATLSKVSDHIKSTQYLSQSQLASSNKSQVQEKMFSPRTSGIFHPKHHLSFVALSVGFLLIWTCVISALLLGNSLSDKYMTEEAEAIFLGHQDVGKVLFALGHEMGENSC